MNYSPPDEQVIAGKVASQAICLAKKLCANPIDGERLDFEVESFIKDNGCVPALKGYKPSFSKTAYKYTVCLSLDNEAVHGLPNKQVEPDQLITVDLVVGHKGWFADTARTFTYAEPGCEVYNFVNMSWDIFKTCISMVMPRMNISTFGNMTSRLCKKAGLSAVSEYCGHGIGKEIHEPPSVIASNNFSMEVFSAGRSFAIEPIICNASSYKLLHSDDGWTVSTNCLSTHNEDTVFVSNIGVVNLTESKEV